MFIYFVLYLSWWKLARVMLSVFTSMITLGGCPCISHNNVMFKSVIGNIIVNFKSCHFLLTVFCFLPYASYPSPEWADAGISSILDYPKDLLLKKYVYDQKHDISGTQEMLPLIKLYLTRQCRARPNQTPVLLLLLLMVSLSRWRRVCFQGSQFQKYHNANGVDVYYFQSWAHIYLYGIFVSACIVHRFFMYGMYCGNVSSWSNL